MLVPKGYYGPRRPVPKSPLKGVSPKGTSNKPFKSMYPNGGDKDSYTWHKQNPSSTLKQWDAYVKERETLLKIKPGDWPPDF